jgi:ATP-dependent Clp protease protease subunit
MRATIWRAAMVATGCGLALMAAEPHGPAATPSLPPLSEIAAGTAADAARANPAEDNMVALPTVQPPSVIASETLPSALLELSNDDAGARLRLDGIITPDVAERFEMVLDSLPAGRPLLLELNSPGGYTGAGYAIIDRLQGERAKGRAVATRVLGGDVCESMCFGLFMAGDHRYAAPGAEFMVHAPRSLAAGTITLRSTGRMVERIRNLGADAAWLDRITEEGAFSGQLDHRETAAELTAENANVVTDLLP